MTDKQQESPLINFMKKQAENKTSKQFGTKKSTSSFKNGEAQKNEEEKKSAENEEEMTEEEKLEEAKKESCSKAGERDQTEMFKKLIIESIIKYVLLITLLVTAALGIIKLGPIAAKFFHGLFFRIVVGN